jgi:ferrous iron transport protein B
MAVPVDGESSFNDVAPEDSVFGVVSETVSPIFAPAGFGNWQATGSLVTGLVAKEVVIGTMSQIYVGEAAVESAEPPPAVGEDVLFIGTSFAEASALTVQEIINIVPRTVNIVPFVSIPEANFFGADGAEDDSTALESALAQIFSPLAAVAFTVFILLYTPCMATVAAMRHEFGGRFTLYQIAYTFVIAWVAAVIVYQGGLLLGIGV